MCVRMKTVLTINELPTNVASMSGIVMPLTRGQMCRKAISFNNVRILQRKDKTIRFAPFHHAEKRILHPNDHDTD